MVLKVDGEEIELGAKVFEDSCVRYRELFPEDVECYTLDTWERL